VAFLLVALLSLHLAFRERPTAHADGAEYLLTAESLFNHGTPNVHPADLLSFGRIAVRHPLEGDFGRPLSHYVAAPDRRLYGVHFWAYSALALPAKLVLRLAGGNEFPNLGLVPYVPLTLALALVLALVRPARRQAESEKRASPAWLLGAVALIAFASTGAANWNHGTVGPSRHGLWLLPFLFVLLAEALEGSGGHGRRLVLPVAVLAALSQGAITFARGGLHAPEDYMRHSITARWVLERWPALYGPTPEIFIERTENREINPDRTQTEPVVYRSALGCRKAWLQKRHVSEVAVSCGGPPTQGPDFRELKAHHGPDVWAYVSW
jgi:hypothetical protein